MERKSGFPQEISKNEQPDTIRRFTFPTESLHQMFKEYEAGTLPINIAQEVLHDLKIRTDDNSWVSIARRGDSALITIGTKPIPSEIIDRWGWGVTEAKDQIHIKASHEYAHFVQNFFDKDLEAFMDRRMQDVSERSHPYLELYALLTQIGRISGLAEEPIYQQQTEALRQQGSDLDMQTYEEIAETIGAWMLGENYYKFRLDNSRTQLSEEQKKRLTDLIEKIFKTWAIEKSKEHTKSESEV